MALEAKIPLSLGSSTWINAEKLVKRSNGFLRLSEINQDKWKLQMSVSRQPKRNLSPPTLDVSCSYNKYAVLKSGGFLATLDESLILKNKYEEIGQYLNGRCIYLVGMMGSGKTTIGRILANVLGYSFFDSDVLVEHAFGGLSVTEIFKLHGEGFFRDNEDYVPETLDSISEFETPGSPDSSYNQDLPEEDDFSKEPVVVPQQLHLTVLDMPEAEEGSSSRPVKPPVLGERQGCSISSCSWLDP